MSVLLPFRSGSVSRRDAVARSSRIFVEAGVSFRWIRVPRFLNTRYAGDAGADFRSAPRVRL
jgi:hypothetical protein